MQRKQPRQRTMGMSVKAVGLWNFRRHLGRPLTGVMFICRADTEEVTLSFEHLAYRWVRPEELAEYPLHASLRKALAQIRPAQLAQAAKLAQQLVGENKWAKVLIR